MTRRFEQLRRVVRPAHVVGVLVSLALAGGAVETRTFGANPEGATRTYLVVKSDNGIHYGKYTLGLKRRWYNLGRTVCFDHVRGAMI